jgi:hypothetical protein
MNNHPIQLAACLFVLVCTALLIGARLDTVWADGDGVTSLPGSVYVMMGQTDVQHNDELRTLHVDEMDERLVRGEIIRTQEKTMAGVTLGNDIELVLDENTDLEIDQLSTEAIEITLHRGRIILDSDHQAVTINGKHSQWVLEDGAITAVNYDFLETIAVAAAEDPSETTSAYLIWNTEHIPLTEPISVIETPPGSWEYTEFNTDLEFYNYVPPALQGVE